MMGERTVMQEWLFYEFNLERHVPPDHQLRSIDRFVELSGIREHLRPFRPLQCFQMFTTIASSFRSS